MIAKIVDENKREYYSAVFAICDNGWNTAVIVFDREKYRFSFVRMYRHPKNLVRGVFIVDCDEEGFVENRSVKINPFKTIHHVSGYPWLVDNRELFIKILKNKQVDESYKETADRINQGIVIEEWTLVKNEQDMKNLMSAAWGFHDGVIEKIVENGDSDSLEVVFSGCWGSRITLLFQSDVHFSSDETESQEFIFGSNVFFENGFVYWVDDFDINSETELIAAKDIRYFKARTLSWKQETEYNKEG